MNPFLSKHKQLVPYNSIKKNRIIRSEKKFTQITPEEPSEQIFINQLVGSIPSKEDVLVQCIEELQSKLQRLKTEDKGKPTPLEHPSSQRTATDNQLFNPRTRSKTNSHQQYKEISKSLNLCSDNKNQAAPQLLDLQALRDEIKKRKKCSVSKRYVTDKQENHQYSNSSSAKKVMSIYRSNRKRVTYDSQAKIRANTQQVLARKEHNQQHRQSADDKSKSKQKRSRATLLDNNEVTNQVQTKQIIDNNQKIGDLSTILQQKETLNFLGQSCLGIKQELSNKYLDKPEIQPSHNESPGKLLQFIDWRTSQLKKAFGVPRDKKRKNGLDRLSKIFPKGFF